MTQAVKQNSVLKQSSDKQLLELWWSFFLEALGEAALLDVAGHLPVAVVRPSIVLAAWREPM